jgi:hypothetical protein
MTGPFIRIPEDAKIDKMQYPQKNLLKREQCGLKHGYLTRLNAIGWLSAQSIRQPGNIGDC